MTAAASRAGGEALAALLDRGEPSRPAFTVPDGGQILTYARVADWTEALAARLAGLGVRRGDRVALTLPNGPDFVVLLLAMARLGAAAAPLNPAYTRAEFGFYLADIGPRLFLIPASRPAEAADAAAAAHVPVAGVETATGGPPGLLAGAEGLGAEGPGADVPGAARRSVEEGDPDDVAVILHTSGTTSRPKQVPLRQRNLMAAARAVAAHYRLGRADVSFCVMPLFHVHGLVASTFAALSTGGAVVVPRRFTPRRFWPQAREHGATWLSASPTLHRMILDQAGGAGPPATLRFARSCSSALSPALLERAERGYQAPMLEAYGMTEASHQMSANPLPPAERKPGSVGVPAGAEIAIIGDGGAFLPEGSPGEVAVRGPGVISGYANDPEATAQAFTSGWFRTGDLGTLRDGYLWLHGRIKEMIIRGGENIAPAEIEEVLLSHPAVRDAACFGIEDDKYGELVAAAVSLSGDAGPRELIGHCRERLAAFKVPVRIDILPELPRTSTGKLQRRRVAETIARRAGREDGPVRKAR